MSTLQTLVLFFLTFISLTFAADSPSAYEMLGKFNFPKGILPQGVKKYTLMADGRFEVELGSDCDFKVEGGYLLKYRKRITGKVEPGVLKELKGASVKVLYMWFGINEVVRDEGNVYFYVGPLSASFPVSNFEECPECLCGFSCQNAEVADALSM